MDSHSWFSKSIYVRTLLVVVAGLDKLNTSLNGIDWLKEIIEEVEMTTLIKDKNAIQRFLDGIAPRAIWLLIQEWAEASLEESDCQS